MTRGEAASLIVAWAAAIVTAVAAVYAGWQASIAHSTLEQAKQTHRDQNQPYVYADIRSDEHTPQLVILIVRNQGPTVARDIEVKIDPPLVVDLTKDQTSFDGWSIFSLPPGAVLKRALGPGWEFFEQNSGVCRLTISAMGPHGPVDKISYNIDLSALGETLAAHKTLSDAAVALGKIAEHTESITKSMKALAASEQGKGTGASQTSAIPNGNARMQAEFDAQRKRTAIPEQPQQPEQPA